MIFPLSINPKRLKFEISWFSCSFCFILFNLLDSLIRKEVLYDASEVLHSLIEAGNGSGWRGNPNCGTKLECNQVHDNPRAFEDFDTIAEANYVSGSIQYITRSYVRDYYRNLTRKFLYTDHVFFRWHNLHFRFNWLVFNYTYDTRKTSEDDLQRVDFQQLFSTRCSKSVAKI